MEFGVKGRPLLPQTSFGRAEAKKVKAPSSASFKGNILESNEMAPSEVYPWKEKHKGKY